MGQVNPQYFVLSGAKFLDKRGGGVVYFKSNSMNGFSVFAGGIGAGEGWIGSECI